MNICTLCHQSSSVSAVFCSFCTLCVQCLLLSIGFVSRCSTVRLLAFGAVASVSIELWSRASWAVFGSICVASMCDTGSCSLCIFSQIFALVDGLFDVASVLYVSLFWLFCCLFSIDSESLFSVDSEGTCCCASMVPELASGASFTSPTALACSAGAVDLTNYKQK